MRFVGKAAFSKRKLVLVFLLAILLPALIAGYLSFHFLSQRRQVLRNLLDANFQASAASALRSVEEILHRHERDILKPENFMPPHPSSPSSASPAASPWEHGIYRSGSISGKLFLLNDRFQVVFPQTESAADPFISWQEDLLNSPFADAYNRAEYYEFTQKDHSRAAELYRQCLALAASAQHKAMALDGMARNFLSSQRFSAAYSAYTQLSTDYASFRNKSGHPFGIAAVLQRHAIDLRLDRQEQACSVLLELYEKLRNGSWLLSLTTFNFFLSEIESSLDEMAAQGRFPEMREAYERIQKQPALYEQALHFLDILIREAVPAIKEKLSLNRISGEALSGRIPIRFAGVSSLISFNILPEFQAGDAFYGGFLWDMEPLKDILLPDILNRVGLASGLRLSLQTDEAPPSGSKPPSGPAQPSDTQNTPDPATPDPALQPAPPDTLSLAFQDFPLPWKLDITQPAFAEQERAARRENLVFGVLGAVIVALILFGAVLIARDVSRESATTRLKSEFVRNVSHEFKTPLSMIRLYAETLQYRSDLTTEQKQNAYQIINKESERLSHMINNVLDLSRIEMGRKEFHFEQGDLPALVRETLDSYRYHLEKKGFTIHADIAADLPGFYFDREALASVVVNLLSNAMKFSAGHKEVSLSLFSQDGRAVLQVADKGIGIAPQELDRIFERFYRTTDRAAPESQGSGLGLPLVKHIVEAHGGEVRVESESGEGSVFSVTLPFERPTDRPEHGKT
jgi:signal transduction histidine kinase